MQKKTIDSKFEVKRGYFGIGIFEGKTISNVGTLWRSAYQLGASFIFTIAGRYNPQSSDTCKSFKHIPLYQYDSIEDFFINGVPGACEIVGIEMGGRNIVGTCHPERAVYVLGAEDRGLSKEMINACTRLIEIPCVRTASYNVSVAGSIVMYDRLAKEIRGV